MSERKKIKVLFLLHLPPPIHGASKVGELIRENKELNSLCSIEYLNIGLAKRINTVGKFSFKKVTPYFKVLFRLIWLLIYSKPKMVYLTINSRGSAFYKEMLYVFFIKLFRVEIVYHYHNKGVATSKRLIDRCLYKYQFRSSKVILLSPILYSDVEEYVAEKDVYYCPNGISDIGNSNRVQNLEPNVCPILLFLSNLLIKKGVFDLIAAIKLLKESGQRFKCVFIGDWTTEITKEAFVEAIEKEGIGDLVKVLGPLYNDEKIEVLTKSDILIYPTHEDCFPLVLLEALSAGLPVVAYSEGAIEDIIKDGVNGYIVEKYHIEGLATKTAELLDSAEKREEFGQLGRKLFLENFTIDQFNRTFTQVLCKIIDDKKYKF